MGRYVEGALLGVKHGGSLSQPERNEEIGYKGSRVNLVCPNERLKV
jgi:hypothetical protein